MTHSMWEIYYAMGQARVGLMGKGKANAASHNLPLQAVNRLVFPYVVEFHAS